MVKYWFVYLLFLYKDYGATFYLRDRDGYRSFKGVHTSLTHHETYMMIYCPDVTSRPSFQSEY